jgi:hypothetical protein
MLNGLSKTKVSKKFNIFSENWCYIYCKIFPSKMSTMTAKKTNTYVKLSEKFEFGFSFWEKVWKIGQKLEFGQINYFFWPNF